MLEKAGLLPYVHAAVYWGDVPNAKPAPDPYPRAAQLVGAHRPLVVEDSDAGERSGLAAGFEVLRVSDPAEVIPALRNKLRVKDN